MTTKTELIEGIEESLAVLRLDAGDEIVLTENLSMRLINSHWGYYVSDAHGWELSVLDILSKSDLLVVQMRLMQYLTAKAQGKDWRLMQPTLYVKPEQQVLF